MNPTWKPYKQIRRLVILVIGITVILTGIVAILLPTPAAVVVIPAGLAILATEFVWARVWLNKAKVQTQWLAMKAKQVIHR